MKPNAVAIFAPGWTSYDRTMVEGLAQGFAACGVEAHSHDKWFGVPMLKKFCKANDVDVVLDINRTRVQLPGLPKRIVHVSWLQDPQWSDGTTVAKDDASDLTYYHARPDLIGFEPQEEIKYLFCGVNEKLANPKVQGREACDFVYVGYIAPLDDEKYAYRHRQRKRVCDLALSASPDSTRLYGRETWNTYERFKSRWKGWLEGADAVLDAYRSAKIVLHENPHGQGLHSRVLDAMSVGACVMCLRGEEGLPGGMSLHFLALKHYFPFTYDNFVHHAKSLLAEPELRRCVGEAARELVLAKHTWRHRAEQILQDLEEL